MPRPFYDHMVIGAAKRAAPQGVSPTLCGNPAAGGGREMMWPHKAHPQGLGLASGSKSLRGHGVRNHPGGINTQFCGFFRHLRGLSVRICSGQDKDLSDSGGMPLRVRHRLDA